MLLNILLILSGLYCTYGTVLFSVQRSMMFPRKYVQPPREPVSSDRLEKIWLPVFGDKVEAWYIPSEATVVDAKRPVVIFGHGNGECIDYCVTELLPYTRMGIDLLIVEYPGYGRSEGRPSKRSITETFVKAYDWLCTNNSIDTSMIFVHGRSVGGGAVCALAEKRNVRAIILQSTFTNTKKFAHGYFVPGFLVRDKFDNLKVIRTFEGPVLIMHGTYDELIPISNGTVLAHAAKNATLVSYPCGHNDCPPDVERYWQDIGTFLAKNGIIPSVYRSSVQ